tara:strand:+ start:5235 stop:5606 length:372 start_codon:yes stop_codon:yes gene_type:complete
MVAHFSYEEPKQIVFEDLRSHLERSGFIIKEYAPEDAFLFTDFKLYDWGTGRRLLAVAIHVTDKITVTGMGKMDIPVSDLGPPDKLLKIKEVDRLPYSIQKKTFLELVKSISDLGYKTLNHWP